MTHRSGLLPAAATVAVSAGVFVVLPVATAAAAPDVRSPGRIDVSTLSSGGKAWFQRPQSAPQRPLAAAARIAFGSNVDANDPQRDLAAGQSETAIAAGVSASVGRSAR